MATSLKAKVIQDSADVRLPLAVHAMRFAKSSEVLIRQQAVA